MSPSSTKAQVGQPFDRVDGRDKVMGRATYSAEWDLPRLTHAVLVTATRGPGRVLAIDTRVAAGAPGVVSILTYQNARPAKHLGSKQSRHPDGHAGGGPPPVPDPSIALLNDQILYPGQPLAVVVAETLEQARAAARLVSVRYHTAPPATDLEANLDRRYAPNSIHNEPPDGHRGDLPAGWRQGQAFVDAVYTTLAESHNPMEPHATTAVFAGGKLTLYDATQYVYGVKKTLAELTELDPKQVRVVCRYVGGGFGSKGSQWPHVTCAALAAIKIGRPVKLVVERRQMFAFVGFRPETHQHVRLAAKSDGTLVAVGHDTVSQTSSYGEFAEPCGLATRMLYACPNTSVTHRLVRLDTQTPTYQRAPGEASGSCALECAMDELAYQLDMDPLALRLKNYAHTDLDKQLPFSSKALDACYKEGAAAFGWSKRPMKPGTLKHGKLLTGWGMATATYPTNRMGASAKVRLDVGGGVVVQIATHDLGTGTYTILTQVAADALGVSVARVKTELGDTDYPEAPVSGGSMSAASASNAVHAAAAALREELIELAIADPMSPLHGLPATEVSWGDGRLAASREPARNEPIEAVLARQGRPFLEAERTTKPGEERHHYSMHAWGAQFAEVQVDLDLGVVRVTRMVGAFAGGKILNPKTARSQFLGGMIMGIGMALLESVHRDPHQGRVVNANLADYLVPVNADVPPIEVLMIPEDDPHVNPLGIKGVGEIGIVGAGAAILNAVYHATGKRVREFPLRIEQLL